jgi:hypothetical protein
MIKDILLETSENVAKPIVFAESMSCNRKYPFGISNKTDYPTEVLFPFSVPLGNYPYIGLHVIIRDTILI